MSENYTNSKKEKLDHHPDRDLLSDLPLSIIHMILALVPIRDAVRTSLLSTQWRYTWTTLHQLTFDNTCASRSRYVDFITRFLFRHNGPIHMFRLSCSGYFRRFDEWIFCLARKDIQELILDLNYHDSSWLWMRSSIYSCKKLTYLNLYSCRFDPPPRKFEGFLFLRGLCLNNVNLDICRFLDFCPLLESFELTKLEASGVKFRAPNLKYMYLRGGFVRLYIDAPLLTEISVELNKYSMPGTYQELKSSVCDYAASFAGFTNLQKLTGSLYFTKYLSLCIRDCQYSWAFHRLKVIRLDHVDFQDVNEILVVANLVISAPNLQQLKVSNCYRNWKGDESDSEALDLSLKDLGFAPNLKLEKLSDVYLSNINGTAIEVEFLKFLLESSPLLETVSVELQDNSYENQNNLRVELQGCNWASPYWVFHLIPFFSVTNGTQYSPMHKY